MTIKSWAGKSAMAVLAAAIVFSTGQPAHAQSTAPGNRSPQAGNSGSSLVNQMEMLKQQNRELLGQVETLRHKIGQLQEINKEQYIALDTRIKRLEKSTPADDGASNDKPASDDGPAEAASAAPASASSAADETDEQAASGASEPAAASSSAPTSNEEAKDAYDAAFDALRAGDFVKSSRGFRHFTEQYPNDKLTPNAWYWLGESYYITQNYKQSLAAFDKVLTRFPDSSKAPGALLKKGYSQYAMKQVDKAEATLKAVVKRYPDSASARLAKQRLEDIRLQQQLN